MWAAARGIAAMDGGMRRGEWIRSEGSQLTGKTIGLLGFGGIAGEVARIAGGSGMRVIAWNRTPKSAPGVTFVDLDTLLKESDVLSVHLLLNDETRGFLSAKRIAQLKPGVILINTARGAVLDEAAMIAALKSGHIRHAGLDVFNTEPLPACHELTTLPNVTLSAHSAFRTPEASETLLRRAFDIARNVPPPDLATPAVGLSPGRSKARGFAPGPHQEARCPLDPRQRLASGLHPFECGEGGRGPGQADRSVATDRIGLTSAAWKGSRASPCRGPGGSAP